VQYRASLFLRQALGDGSERDVMTEPYYADESVTLYHGDCLEILPSLGPVDLVMTDPPYSLSVGQDHQNKPGRGTRRLNFFEGDLDWSSMTDGVVARALLGASKANAAYVWCGHRQFGPLVEAFESSGWKTRFLVWSKRCPVPAPPGVGWDSSAELCVYAFRDGRQWTPPTGTKAPNIISADSYRHGQPGKVDHPTQKPPTTASIPIEFSTRPGDTVLDIFAGSGTTLRVAKDMGRKAIGIEIEERYCEVIARRLSQGVLDFGGVA
jgi:site-specific DNA-methyltransferase (adenine-specific)